MSQNNGALRKHERRVGALYRFTKNAKKAEPKQTPEARSKELLVLAERVRLGNSRFGGASS